ncbi:hypothetical protein [Kitasatospora sp. NPDC048538]|uniref:hypothetical protein n=1 Tax=unclassified Kitasatospora TaxID=2633591 RepID=UPI003401D0C3
MFTMEETVFDAGEMPGLDTSVGWEGCTGDVDRPPCRGLCDSHLVITARDGLGTLLGLARNRPDRREMTP